MSQAIVSDGSRTFMGNVEGDPETSNGWYTVEDAFEIVDINGMAPHPSGAMQMIRQTIVYPIHFLIESIKLKIKPVLIIYFADMGVSDRQRCEKRMDEARKIALEQRAKESGIALGANVSKLHK